MNTPRVTETVPDSIRAREQDGEQPVPEREPAPAEPATRPPAEKPALFHRISSR